MNKKQQELLDKCIKVEKDTTPSFDMIHIIQQRKLHDSGYRMMYVIGYDRDLKQYFLLNDYSDVIDINVSNCKDLRMDIDRDGIITIWSWRSKLKSTFRVSSCCFETCYKEDN